MTTSTHDRPSLLAVGASRGLGAAMAAAFADQGWHVTGTVRGSARTMLHDIAERHPGNVAIEPLDITEPDQIAALHDRLAGRRFDMLFVNAGIANRDPAETIGETATEEFVRVMLTNVLGVMRTVERLGALVHPRGLIGVMSSGQGSIADNVRGGREVYRGSKAALNQHMRSYAARQPGDGRALVLVAPGWIRTDLGGPDAPFTMEETVPLIVDMLIAQQGEPGLRYLDRYGNIVPW
jgi:NAD(P)-dependent dehydrogenase (short-subunit alcohol dehydrogenase family)